MCYNYDVTVIGECRELRRFRNANKITRSYYEEYLKLSIATVVFALQCFINFIVSIMTVIKGEVLRVEEVDSKSMLEYYVEVKKIIQQGYKNLKVGGVVVFWKRSVCKSLELKEKNEYLFMGQDKGGRYELDEKSFVKLWPGSNENNNDKRTLNKFAKEYTCPTSST